MMLAIVLFFFAIVFAAAVIAVAAGSAAMGRLSPGDVTAADENPLLIRSEELSSIGVWSSLLARFDFVHRLKTLLAQADLGWSVGRITLLMLLSGAVCFTVLLNWSWIPGWAAVAGGATGILAPYFYVNRRRRRRFNKLSQQFPEALDSLARAMRAGHPVAAALDLVGEESTMPLSGELRRTVAEVQLGLPVEQAMNNLAVRVPLLEVGIFSSALRLQVRTGGKLSEVIERLAESMREAEALRSEVRAIAAHGRMTGIILTILPIFIAAIMATVNPDYLKSLFVFKYGRDLIAAAIGCLILAHFIIRRIVDIRL
ncbi:MAG: type II secretion system F family protein [Bryobacterales bacterium]|nr:type II secretion system F family protein [Bryobacterales bacterium]